MAPWCHPGIPPLIGVYAVSETWYIYPMSKQETVTKAKALLATILVVLGFGFGQSPQTIPVTPTAVTIERTI